MCYIAKELDVRCLSMVQKKIKGYSKRTEYSLVKQLEIPVVT